MPTKVKLVKRQLGGKGFENNPQNINRAGGPPKTHWWTQLLMQEADKESMIQAVAKDGEKMKALKRKEVMAKALVDKAEAGDLQALKEFGDRVQGKAPQGVGTLDDDGSFKEQNCIPIIFE